jgi:hypothetical protein
MTTVGALVIHASQVHKETLKTVPNAKEGRDSLDVQVYGMENVPDELLLQGTKRTRMTQGEVDAENGAAQAQGAGGGQMFGGGMPPGGSTRTGEGALCEALAVLFPFSVALSCLLPKKTSGESGGWGRPLACLRSISARSTLLPTLLLARVQA